MTRVAIVLLLLGCGSVSHATTYYISPSGNNGNAGTSSGSPWGTFAYAINAARAWCGHTLVLMDGTYGDGTATGKISLNNLNCSSGSLFVITAANQRKSKIVDNGSGVAVFLQNSSYISIEDLYLRSTDNNGATTSGNGTPLRAVTVHHITVRGNLFRNPNRFANSHTATFLYSTDITMEDNESYVFHRHCVSAGASERMVVRRQYCNPRGGRIEGGFGTYGGASPQGPVGTAGTVFTMYPCKDCILENSIFDGETTGGGLIEMNANFDRSVSMSDAKILGNICYKCDFGNAVNPNSRNSSGLDRTPQNMVMRGNAIVDFASNSSAFKVEDCVNCEIDHTTILGVGSLQDNGIVTSDKSFGVPAAQNSITVTNTLAGNLGGNGFNMNGFDTWTVDRTISSGNGGAPYLPATDPPSGSQTLSNTSTVAHNMGTCKVWVPSGAAGKGAGVGGSDIGANILYRYVNGILTSIPLWDPVTGSFPHGDTDADGTNAVAGQSAFDIHERLNVNRNGCPFPAGYGSTAPTTPSNVLTTDSTEGAHVMTIPPGTTALTVMVAVRHDGSNVAQVTGVTSSCGTQDVPGRIASWGTLAGDRSMRVFGLLNPTSGTCTLTPAFDDPTRVSGWIMISRTDANVSAYANTSAGSGLSSTPSGTVTAGPNDVILGFLATSKVPTLSAGPDQIFLADKLHATKVLRGALSEQSGSHGGNVTWVLGASVAWIEQNIVLVTTGGGGGSGSTFRINTFRIDGLLGQNAAPEVTLGALAAENAPAKIGIGGSLRIRTNIIVEVAPSTETGFALYCKKNAGAFARITNVFGSNDVRLMGPGSDANTPIDGQLTTQRFTGPFNGGVVKRDDDAPGTLPSTPTNTNIETDHLLVTGNAAGNNDQFLCEIRRDDGSRLSGPSDHTVTPAFQTVTPGASMMF